MQDSNKYRQQLVDQGWQQMSILLNKEMPQTGKRRRTAIWWIVGAGMALILSGWGYFLLQNNAKEQPLKQVEESPKIETAMSPVIDHSQVQKTEPLLADKPKTSGSETGVSGSTEDVMRQDGSIVTKPIASLRQTPKPRELPLNSITRTIDAESDFATDKVVVGNEIGQPSESITTTEDMQVSLEVESREIIMPVQLDRNSFDQLDQLDAPLAFPSIEVKPRVSRKVALEALAATHMNADGNPFYGVETGLNAVVKSGRRLSVSAGLTYGYYNIDGLEFLGFSKDEDIELDNSNNPGQNTGYLYDVNALFSHTLAVSEVKQISEKFHYLHLPVTVSYSISPRIAVSAGLKLSTLIAAPARYRLNDTRFSGSALSNTSRDFLVSYDILRKWDIAPMVSLIYRVNKKFSIDASYAHGLVHYVNSSGPQDKSDLHRSGSIGVRYRLF